MGYKESSFRNAVLTDLDYREQTLEHNRQEPPISLVSRIALTVDSPRGT